MWPELKCVSILKTRNVDLGWVNMRPYNFFVNVPKFTNLLSNARGIAVD